VISGLAVRNKLNNSDGYGGEQEDVNEAAFMQDKLQNEPNHQKCSTNRPHSRNLSNALSKSFVTLTA
jgi:hypothetical protein